MADTKKIFKCQSPIKWKILPMIFNACLLILYNPFSVKVLFIKYSIDGKIASGAYAKRRRVREKDTILNLHWLYRVNK